MELHLHSALQGSRVVLGGLKPLRRGWVLPSSSCLVLQQQSLLGHGSSVPWEQAKGPFLCRPSSSVPRLLLFPAWLRWSWGWISWGGEGGAGGRTGGQKSISPSRKTEKGFQLSSPRRPRSYTLCLCSLRFPFLSPRFPLLLSFFFFSVHIPGGAEWSVGRGYTFPLMCANNRHSSMDCLILLNTGLSGQIPWLEVALLLGMSFIIFFFLCVCFLSKWPKYLTCRLFSVVFFSD